MLLKAGANKDSQDNYGRSPLQLAIAAGISDSVNLLIQVDCNLSTYLKDFGIVKQALSLGPSIEHDKIIATVTTAIASRYHRFMKFAKGILPEKAVSELDISGNEIVESKSEEICAAIKSRGINVPRELVLGKESVYEVTDLHACARMTTEVAEHFWTAGFRDIDRPGDSHGLSPILQNWFVANLDMVAWFIEKGVSPYSMHRDGHISGLHLYAKRFQFPGGYFEGNPDRIESNMNFIDQLLNKPDIYRDECRCICSPDGCTPVKFLYSTSYRPLPSAKLGYDPRQTFRVWMKKTVLSKEMLAESCRDMARFVHFTVVEELLPKLKPRHTCCSLGQVGDLRRPQETDESLLSSLGPNLTRAFELGMELYEKEQREYQGPLENLSFRSYRRL